MKKYFEEMELEMIAFEASDVIATSGGSIDGDGDAGNQDTGSGGYE